jgi:hypothetical protein
MMAVRTQYTAADLRGRGALRTLHAAISAVIPLSAGQITEKEIAK